MEILEKQGLELNNTFIMLRALICWLRIHILWRLMEKFSYRLSKKLVY